MKVELSDLYQLLEQVVANQVAMDEKINHLVQQKAVKPKPVEAAAQLDGKGKVVE
jgi:hypothetical protein